MKNRIFSTFFSVLLSLSLLAQANAVYQATTSVITAADNAKDVIEQIIDVVGLKPNFEVRAARIDNAAAVIYGGKRYILYNPNFFNSLTKSTGTRWAAVSVLAHEIGHHLDGHTLSQIGSEPKSELEADEFSGFVLRKMGASLTQAQAAMKTAATQRATSTHPAQYDRLTAIANGWNKADAQIAGKKFEPKKNAQAQQPSIATKNYPSQTNNQTVIDSRYIIGDVRFKTDPNSLYYVTTRYNLVRVSNNQLSVIGKLAQINSSDYPYIIYDGSNTQLLVDSYGNIVTRQGKPVGKLSARKG
jgi:predicted HD phosphohydrolase